MLLWKLFSAKVFFSKFWLQAVLLQAPLSEGRFSQKLLESKLGKALVVKLLWPHSAEPSCWKAACCHLLLSSWVVEAVLCKLLRLSGESCCLQAASCQRSSRQALLKLGSGKPSCQRRSSEEKGSLLSSSCQTLLQAPCSRSSP